MANKFLSNINLTAGLEADGDSGSAGQVLSSTGTGVEWIDQSASNEGADLVYFEAKNSTGSTLSKGTGVMAVGTDGNSGHILINAMVGDGSVESKYFLGVLEEDLSNGNTGRVISFGMIDQFDTRGQNGEAWNDGEILWCDPVNAGDFTTTEPDGPNVKIAAAIILNSSTNGKIQVRVQANEGIHDLHDTKITSQVDGDVLVWDNTTGVWFNDSTLNVDYTNSRVGIGTTSPERALDVEGTIQGSNYLFLQHETNSDFGIKVGRKRTNNGVAYLDLISAPDPIAGDHQFRIFRNSGDNGITDIIHKGTGSLVFDNVNNADTIFSNGNVGIGTTNPGYTLDVNGSFHSTNINIADGIYHEGDTNNYFSFGTDTQAFTTSGVERMRITSSGSLGVGTTNPITNGGSTAKVLHLHNSISDWSLGHYTNGATGSGAADGSIVGQIGLETYIWNYENSNLKLGTNSVTRYTIDSSGYNTWTEGGIFGGVITATGGNSTEWNTAYGWGNHAAAGYITGYTETDTLDSVADRGRTTNQQLISTNTSGFRVDSGSYARMEIDSNNNWSYIRFQDNGTTSWDFATFDAGDLEIRPGGGSSNRTYFDSSGNSFSEGSKRAPIFYDLNNTGYYLNPAGTSTLGFANFEGYDNTSANARTTTGVSIGRYTSDYSYIELASTHGTNRSWIDFSDASGSDYVHRLRSHSDRFGIYSSSGEQFRVFSTYTDSVNSSRAPIFYDTDNTNYYLDPASTSNLNELTVNGTLTASNFSGSSSGTNTGDQDLSGYLLNTTDAFTGNLTFNGGNNSSKESFINVKRGSGAGLWLKFQTDSTTANNVSQFVIRRSTDNLDLLSINTSSGNLAVPGTLSSSNLSGTNTGDQDLSGYALTSHNHDGRYLRTYPRYQANLDTINSSGVYIWDVSEANDDPSGSGDGLLTVKYWDSVNWATASFQDFHNRKLYIKSKKSGTWQTDWAQVWTTDQLTTTNKANYDTAYGWGDHSAEGYLTSLPSHNHDDRYFTESESNNRFAYKAGSSGQDFYVDDLYYDQWIRNNNSSNSGLHWESGNPGYGWHVYPQTRQDITFRTGLSNGGIKGTIENETARGYIHWTTSNEIGFLNASRSWSLRVDNSGNTFATSSSRAPVFYDSNNTSYYLNPTTSGTSAVLRGNIRIEKGNSTGTAIEINNVRDSSWPFEFTTNDVGNDNPSGFWVGSNGQPDMRLRGDGSTVRALISSWERSYTTYGLTDSTDMRAPIFYDNNNTAYYLDPSSTGTSMKVAGKVGIGTTNPQAKLEVNGTIRVHDSGDTVFEADGSTGSFTLGDIEELADGALITGNSSEIRITHLGNTTLVADGNHRVGIGTDNPTSKLHVAGDLTSGTIPLVTIDADWNGVYGTRTAIINGVDYGNGVSFYRNGTYDGTACSFYNGSSKVGSIGISTSSTFYNTSSDYRLKENVVGISDGIERLKLLKPSRFNFIGETAVVDGFIAHEAQSVIPEAVTGEKDGELPNGEPEYQGIDQSKIVPLLTAALQEAIQKIEQLETRITQLENNN